MWGEVMAKKRGRKLIEIDRGEFERLCIVQCTLEEIAGAFMCSVDTIERWCKREYGMTFSEIYKTKGGAGKISLRRNMFRMAETNVAMAIWLSKQYLGMKDVVETDATISSDNKLEVVWKINDED